MERKTTSKTPENQRLSLGQRMAVSILFIWIIVFFGYAIYREVQEIQRRNEREQLLDEFLKKQSLRGIGRSLEGDRKRFWFCEIPVPSCSDPKKIPAPCRATGINRRLLLVKLFQGVESDQEQSNAEGNGNNPGTFPSKGHGPGKSGRTM
jgi:hypothetical protein